MNDILYEDLETLPSFTSQFPTESLYNYRSYSTFTGVSYFVKDPSLNPKLDITSYTHIEPVMRYFVYLMRTNGLLVTSGWKGINNPKAYFEKLKIQEQKIQKTGVQMFEFLSGSEIFFKDKSYRVPYSTVDDFIKIGEQLKYDSVGLLVPVTSDKMIKNLSKEPYETGLSTFSYEIDLDVKGERFAYYKINIRKEDDKSNLDEWRNLCSWILSNLEKKTNIY